MKTPQNKCPRCKNGCMIAVDGNGNGSCQCPCHTAPTTISEAVKELSDTIWNHSGKHSHNELDETIRTKLTKIITSAIEEIEKEIWVIPAHLPEQAHHEAAIRKHALETAIQILKRTLE